MTKIFNGYGAKSLSGDIATANCSGFRNVRSILFIFIFVYGDPDFENIQMSLTING